MDKEKRKSLKKSRKDRVRRLAEEKWANEPSSVQCPRCRTSLQVPQGSFRFLCGKCDTALTIISPANNSGNDSEPHVGDAASAPGSTANAPTTSSDAPAPAAAKKKKPKSLGKLLSWKSKSSKKKSKKDKKSSAARPSRDESREPDTPGPPPGSAEPAESSTSEVTPEDVNQEHGTEAPPSAKDEDEWKRQEAHNALEAVASALVTISDVRDADGAFCGCGAFGEPLL